MEEKIDINLRYGTATIPILVMANVRNTVSRVSFTFFDTLYEFCVSAWNEDNIVALVQSFNQYHKHPYDLHPTVEKQREVIRASAIDIVRTMLNIWKVHGVALLNYAVYHRKNFFNDFSYGVDIVHLACQAIIDCNFFAFPSPQYERMTLS